MRRILTIPDGRSIATTSNKRWHLVIVGQGGMLLRYTSSNRRERIEQAYETTRRYWPDRWIVETP